MHKLPLALFAPLLFLSAHAHAAFYSTNYLNIEVQPGSYNSWVPYWADDVAAGTAPYEILSDGVRFSPGEHIGGGGEELGYSGDSGALIFDVTDLKFFAKSGYRITGYELSFSGQLWASSGAVVAVGGELMPAAGTYPEYTQRYYQSPRWTPYSFSTIIGADNPAGGNVTARGAIAFDAQAVMEYGECCDEFGLPYEYIVDYSWAEINIDSVTLKAIVAPIPEPETSLMFLAGIGAIAWRMRRAGAPAPKG